jgi:hypothetical protein
VRFAIGTPLKSKLLRHSANFRLLEQWNTPASVSPMCAV